ncbi:MAG: NAD-dependent epimerase/dehydratase family protein, partial [Mesorhizobium sp.]|nr:NAD-dependent epimerase/dehydratase family protein [Mesorhizobium sp.]
MTVEQVFIFGAGYSGKAFARACSDGTPVYGTTRAARKFAALEAAGIRPLEFQGALTPKISDALADTTHLVVSVAPDEAGDPVLNAAGTAIRQAMPKLKWIGYLSTVGVYGDYGGGWVDETAQCRPVSRRSMMRVEAEKSWLALGEETGLPVAILRLSGIYGPGRNALVNLKEGTARRLVKAGQVFNRIHVEDIAGALLHLAGQDRGGIFNVTDSKIIKLFVDDEPFWLPRAKLLSYDRRLNMKSGTLDREILWKAPSGKRVSIVSRRLVSFVERHVAAISYRVTVTNAAASLVISSEMNAHKP